MIHLRHHLQYKCDIRAWSYCNHSQQDSMQCFRERVCSSVCFVDGHHPVFQHYSEIAVSIFCQWYVPLSPPDVGHVLLQGNADSMMHRYPSCLQKFDASNMLDYRMLESLGLTYMRQVSQSATPALVVYIRQSGNVCMEV